MEIWHNMDDSPKVVSFSLLTLLGNVHLGLLFCLCFRMDLPQRNKLRIKKCVSSQDDMKKTSEVILR